MSNVCCSSCSKPLASVKWCQSCKKVAYCNRICQKNDWKRHRPTCTFDFIKAQDKAYQHAFGNTTKKGYIKLSPEDQPFNSIDTSIFSKNQFISVVSNCNSDLLPAFAIIIYKLLTGYEYHIDVSSLSINGKTKIESYMDANQSPPIDIKHKTNFEGNVDGAYRVLDTLENYYQHCDECAETQNTLDTIVSEFYDNIQNVSEDELNLKNKIVETAFLKYLKAVYLLNLCHHVTCDWNAFTFYIIQWVRDTTDDSMSILLEMYHDKNEPRRVGYNVYSIACFKCNDIMPYFDGALYAKFTKLILDHYQFQEKYYHKIESIGFSWSISADKQLRFDYLKNIKTLFHSDISTLSDYFAPAVFYDHPDYHNAVY